MARPFQSASLGELRLCSLDLLAFLQLLLLSVWNTLFRPLECRLGMDKPGGRQSSVRLEHLLPPLYPLLIASSHSFFVMRNSPAICFRGRRNTVVQSHTQAGAPLVGRPPESRSFARHSWRTTPLDLLLPVCSPNDLHALFLRVVADGLQLQKQARAHSSPARPSACYLLKRKPRGFYCCLLAALVSAALFLTAGFR